MQIQHANNASDRQNNHDTFNIDLSAKHMNELSAMMRQACKENAEQNENSNQHASLHHNIHLKNHASNSMSHIQHNDQISLDAQNHNLIHELKHKQIRNDMSEL